MGRGRKSVDDPLSFLLREPARGKHLTPVRLKVFDPFSRSHRTLSNFTVRVVTVTAKY